MRISTAPLHSLIKPFQDSAVSLLYPTSCYVCGASLDSLADGVACHKCWQIAEDTRLNFDSCTKCDLLLPRSQLRPQIRSCGACTDFAFTAARACGSYRGAFRESVLRLKVQPVIPARLRQLLHETFWLLPDAQEIEAIIPVPLHSARQRQRKYNQAEIIAQTLSRTTKLPVHISALIRNKPTEQHRGGMDAQARQQSLRGAFQVRAPRLIENRSLVLVDDVMTSGATAHEIAQTLHEQGASAVSVITIARASHIFS